MPKVEIKEIRERLLATGWQSWSPRAKSPLGIPAWNDPPFEDTYLPVSLGQRTTKKPVRGWCSWYAFGPFITEEKITRQLEWFGQHREIPVEYFLVDGGWERWKNTEAALKRLIETIKKMDFKPGIWLAPFNRGTKFTATDLLGLGFELIKLDFLYRVYHQPGVSAQEAGRRIRNLLLDIRQRYPEVYTIACGCPLLPAVNVVDSMRIGPDTVDPIVTSRIPVLNGIVNFYKLRLIKSNLERRFWTKRFWNLDPDVFVCRRGLGLSDRQILSLQKIVKKTSGNIFLGDDMTKLSEERIKRFILPLFEK